MDQQCSLQQPESAHRRKILKSYQICQAFGYYFLLLMLYSLVIMLGIDVYPFSQMKWTRNSSNPFGQCPRSMQPTPGSMCSMAELGTYFSHLGYRVNYRYGNSFSISRQMRNSVQVLWRKLRRRLYPRIIPWPSRCIHFELFLKLRLFSLWVFVRRGIYSTILIL
jgi:hypothetical protein